jgi:hypothetical protein
MIVLYNQVLTYTLNRSVVLAQCQSHRATISAAEQSVFFALFVLDPEVVRLDCATYTQWRILLHGDYTRAPRVESQVIVH